jgi:hypothetical protein
MVEVSIVATITKEMCSIQKKSYLKIARTIEKPTTDIAETERRRCSPVEQTGAQMPVNVPVGDVAT